MASLDGNSRHVRTFAHGLIVPPTSRLDDLDDYRRDRTAQGTTGMASRVRVSPSHGYETATAIASTSPLQAAWADIARDKRIQAHITLGWPISNPRPSQLNIRALAPPAWGCWRRSRSAPVPLF
ncbi:hypothetical protein CCMA1212_004014 [Trichoderma ghanense]|uniref:Uncharacterized protein n=1 Tax=Trichoderma ghanense TaxID=65468 RepID=A0ABY2H7F2_9HYPO